jgi:cobaltochelatase CobN
VALSDACWPEALIGSTPVIYPFIVNDPGEAAQAKRRIGAVTLGHVPPPLRPSGTPQRLAASKRSSTNSPTPTASTPAAATG